MTSQNTIDNSSLQNNEHVHSITVKLPPFWPSNPEVWFHQVEAQFAIAKIKADRTKYDYVVAALPLQVISNIYDILEKPPLTDLYVNIKNKIIQRLTASEEKRLDVLLSNSEMGDRKPSDFFRDMVVTAGGSSMVSNDLLIRLWQRHLPKTISIAITASGKSELNDILDIADKIWETYKDPNISFVNNQQSNHVASTSTQILPQQVLQAFTELSIKCKETLDCITNKNTILEQKLDFLQTQVNAFKQNTYRRDNFQGRRERSHSRNRGNRSRYENSDDICYFHKKYKDKAFKCAGPWCKFLAKAQHLN